ncbi:MAG: hypothetical protein EXR62_18460 [Chloroflexi bacterium]|nr:hypothetical protein [Chloroflexota bacterium]
MLAQYAANRFVQPARARPQALLELDRLAFSLAGRIFEPLELAPVCPLGSNAVVGTVDQNITVATIRNTEVVSDSTNVLALECALRRRALLRIHPRALDRIRLCASHRLLRAQHYSRPGLAPHFRLFGMCTAGRDEGEYRFEMEALVEHIACHLELMAACETIGYPVHEPQVALTSWDNAVDAALLQRAITLSGRFPLARFTCDRARRDKGEPSTLNPVLWDGIIGLKRHFRGAGDDTMAQQPQITIPLDLPDVSVRSMTIDQERALIINVASTLTSTTCRCRGQTISVFYGYDRPLFHLIHHLGLGWLVALWSPAAIPFTLNSGLTPQDPGEPIYKTKGPYSDTFLTLTAPQRTITEVSASPVDKVCYNDRRLPKLDTKMAQSAAFQPVDIRIFASTTSTEYRVELSGPDQIGFAPRTLKLDRVRLLSLEADPAAYGLALGRALFAEDVLGRAYQGTLARSPRLRVRLHLNPPELHAVHWERIYYPLPGGHWEPLGVTGDTPFSRYVYPGD